MVVFVSHFHGVVEGALVTVYRYLVAEVVTFIGNYQEVRMGIEMQAVSIRPKKWLHDWRQGKERGLV